MDGKHDHEPIPDNNDINFGFAVRRPDGEKPTRSDILNALLSLAMAWDQNAEEWTHGLFDEDASIGVTMIVPGNNMLFGEIYTDKITAMRNEMTKPDKQSDQEQGPDDLPVPYNVIQQVTNLLRKHKRDLE